MVELVSIGIVSSFVLIMFRVNNVCVKWLVMGLSVLVVWV